MLALTRKEGESLLIGEGIEVQVVRVKGKSVRLAISAPREVRVLRKEVFEAIRAANLAAVFPRGTLSKKEGGD